MHTQKYKILKKVKIFFVTKIITACLHVTYPIPVQLAFPWQVSWHKAKKSSYNIFSLISLYRIEILSFYLPKLITYTSTYSLYI